MKTILFYLGISAFCLLPYPTAHAETQPNIHNIHDCLFCHEDSPRFGVDTKNTVTFKESSWDDPSLCLRCHTPDENLHPVEIKPVESGRETVRSKNLPLGTSPGLEDEIVCETCHFIHASETNHALLRGFPGSQKPGLFRSWQQLCMECHGKDLEKQSPHAGNEKVCAYCHMSTPQKGEAVFVGPEGADLCNFCHGGIQNEHFANANPFTDQVTCIECHDPHRGEAYPARLRESYFDAAKGLVSISPHYKKVLCFTCHKEGEGYPLVSDDPTALCNRCHGTEAVIGDSHPLREIPSEMKIPEGFPLKGDSLSCLTCHLAGHQDDRQYYKFLRGGRYDDRNDFCFQCHDQESFRERDPHQDINRLQGCEFCHTVRPVIGDEETQKASLAADVNLLCLRCHEYDPHPSGVTHTVKPTPEMLSSMSGELPLDREGRVTCATCHNPHIEDVGGSKLRGGVQGMMICSNCHRY